MDNRDLYIETFLDNYNGVSDEAKALDGHLKKTYKNDPYVPWQLMDRLAKLQDPKCYAKVVPSPNGDLVWSQGLINESQTINGDNQVIKKSTILTHVVVLEGEFMGRKDYEYYAITDNAYQPVRAITSTMIANSIQRGKTKLLSRLSGLAFKIYEGSDLQFGEPGSDEAPVELPTTGAVKDENKPQSTPTVDASDNTQEVLTFIRSNSKAFGVLDSIFNKTLVSKYGAGITDDMTDEAILDVLGKIDNLPVFFNALKMQSNK